jgi:hypothetical protein
LQYISPSPLPFLHHSRNSIQAEDTTSFNQKQSHTTNSGNKMPFLNPGQTADTARTKSCNQTQSHAKNTDNKIGDRLHRAKVDPSNFWNSPQ